MTNGLVCTCWRMHRQPDGRTRHQAGCMLHHHYRPHNVDPTDAVTFTRTITITYERGDGPLIKTPVRDFQVTTLRLVYRWTTTGWTTEIGPVHGYPMLDENRLGSRTRSIPPRDHTPEGWPTWLTALAAEHTPTTRITVQED